MVFKLIKNLDKRTKFIGKFVFYTVKNVLVSNNYELIFRKTLDTEDQTNNIVKYGSGIVYYFLYFYKWHSSAQLATSGSR